MYLEYIHPYCICIDWLCTYFQELLLFLEINLWLYQAHL